MKNPKVHIVQPGDTFYSIARRYGFKDWRYIYGHPLNRHLKKEILNPDRIPIGLHVNIPPNLEGLKELLAAQKRVCKSIENAYQEELQFLDREYSKLKQTRQNVETAAMVINILRSLTGITKQGLEAAKLEGEALEKAGRKLSKEVLIFSYEPIFEHLLELITGLDKAPTGEESLGWAITKILYQSWQDMQSPSYWAERATGANPDEIYRQARQEIIRTRGQALKNANGRYNNLEREIRKLGY